jgi:excisionase family DNA binding protein
VELRLEKLYSLPELEELTAVPEATWRRWLAEGRIPRTRIGGTSIRIRQSAVEKILEDGVKDEARAARCRRVGRLNKVNKNG